MSEKLLSERLRVEKGSDRLHRGGPLAHTFVSELDGRWANYLPAASYEMPYKGSEPRGTSTTIVGAAMRKLRAAATLLGIAAIIACGKTENPVGVDPPGGPGGGDGVVTTTSTTLPPIPPPPSTPPTTMTNEPRQFWYPSIGPFPVCDTCAVVYAYVANNTGSPQRIGLAVYTPLANGQTRLWSAAYQNVTPNASPDTNEWQTLINFGGRPLNCKYAVFLSAIPWANFDPNRVNAHTDGYLIATATGGDDKPYCQ